MTTLALKRESYAQLLAQELDNLIRQLRQIPAVQRVILFGSYAHGTPTADSDLDLLVVMDSDLDFVSRTARLYQQLQPGVDLDLLVYTPEEFEQMRQHGIVRQALENGRVLYEKVAP